MSFITMTDSDPLSYPVAGFILTGGKNSRMKGNTKFFLKYEGKIFGKHILAALDCLDRIYLSVNHTEPYSDLGIPLVQDEIREIGPLGGILSGLHQIPDHALFVATSDTPFLDRGTVLVLLDAYRKNPVLTVASVNGHLQPLLGIYPPDMKEILETRLQRADFRMRTLVEETESQIVPVTNEKLTWNINTPEDYRKFCCPED